MRKLILSICLVITGLILSSCDLDPVRKYDFTYAANLNVESKETSEQILKYLEDVISDEKSFSITASRFDAINEALPKFQALTSKIDDEKICVLLKKGEFAQLCLMVSSSKSASEVIAYTTWVCDDDKIEKD